MRRHTLDGNPVGSLTSSTHSLTHCQLFVTRRRIFRTGPVRNRRVTNSKQIRRQDAGIQNETERNSAIQAAEAASRARRFPESRKGCILQFVVFCFVLFEELYEFGISMAIECFDLEELTVRNLFCFDFLYCNLSRCRI